MDINRRLASMEDRSIVPQEVKISLEHPTNASDQSNAPIHQLPNEILVRIFTYTATDKFDYNPTLLLIGRTCRRFRQLAKHVRYVLRHESASPPSFSSTSVPATHSSESKLKVESSPSRSPPPEDNHNPPPPPPQNPNLLTHLSTSEREFPILFPRDYYPCYTCLSVLPKDQFADNATRKGRGINGVNHRTRFCLDCGIQKKIYTPDASPLVGGKYLFVCRRCRMFVVRKEDVGKGCEIHGRWREMLRGVDGEGAESGEGSAAAATTTTATTTTTVTATGSQGAEGSASTDHGKGNANEKDNGKDPTNQGPWLKIQDTPAFGRKRRRKGTSGGSRYGYGFAFDREYYNDDDDDDDDDDNINDSYYDDDPFDYMSQYERDNNLYGGY